MSSFPTRAPHVRRAALVALFTAVATLLAAGPAAAVGPTPVTVTGGPVATYAAPATPFATTIYVNIYAGTNSGAANGNFTGVQAVTVPAGKRLVVQSMSAYRFGTVTNGTSVQVFADAATNGSVNAWAIPPIVAVGSDFPGTTVSVTFYVDAGNSMIVNGYRNSTASTESVAVSISGYLVDAP